MAKQVVEIIVKKDGTFSFKALEGFKGESCRKQTKSLELVLGGEAVDTENTKDFFDGGAMSINTNLKL